MSNPNFDHSEGDWEEFSSGPSWGESQWRNYLHGSDKDTERFLSVYKSVKNKPNHLVEVETLMGWDVEDISLTDEFTFIEEDEERPSSENSSAPYTLHRHPVFVFTRALYRYLHQSWEHYMLHSERSLTPKISWDYSNSLHQGEMNVLLSIQALDLGDYGLSICHLKNSLSALNQTLSLLDQLDHPSSTFLNGFRKEAQIRIYDLRELWIRVMGDCRHECQRRLDDQE